MLQFKSAEEFSMFLKLHNLQDSADKFFYTMYGMDNKKTYYTGHLYTHRVHSKYPIEFIEWYDDRLGDWKFTVEINGRKSKVFVGDHMYLALNRLDKVIDGFKELKRK